MGKKKDKRKAQKKELARRAAVHRAAMNMMAHLLILSISSDPKPEKKTA